MRGATRTLGDKRLAAALGPLDTVFATKFIKTLAVDDAPSQGTTTTTKGITESGTGPQDTFKPGMELMYGGQGKITNTTNLTTVTKTPTARTGETEYGGLAEPGLDDTGTGVGGDEKGKLRKQNKRLKQQLKAAQIQGSQWTEYTGQVPYESTTMPRTRGPHRNFMCPTGRALNHPASQVLCDWAMFGCPTRTGRNWSKDEMWEAVERGPHRSAMSSEALAYFAEEIKEKLRTKQARLVAWEDIIKDNPPPQLKISPIAAIPHKSKAFRSILDLSFRLRLKNGGVLLAVNDTTVKTAPKGAIDQLGECLSRIIHAFAEVDDDA